MLERVTVVDRIEILPETGHVQVRRATFIAEDGVRVSEPTYHREVLEPGAVVDQQSDVVRAVAMSVWTPAVLAKFARIKAAHDGRASDKPSTPKAG